MSLARRSSPPDGREPYIIGQLEGERITIPGSKGVFRILASSKQTGGTMAVFQSAAVLSDAPGFHYHNEAHDVFLVTKGYLKLWNGEKCRIMGPGDFAYVPPVSSFLSIVDLVKLTNTAHCSQPRVTWPTHRNIRSSHSRRLGRFLPSRL